MMLPLHDAAVVAVQGLPAAVGASLRLILSPCLAPGHRRQWPQQQKKGQNTPFLPAEGGTVLGALLPEEGTMAEQFLFIRDLKTH